VFFKLWMSSNWPTASYAGHKACGRREVVALDGKSVRRALNRGEDFRVIVSAWATESSLLLGQRKVRDKSNEITAVPELLQALELAGCIVTADAMHCQKNIAKEIIEADDDYVLVLKRNQGTAFAEVKSFLEDAVNRADKALVHLEAVEKGHGRHETRRCWQIEQISWYTDRGQWSIENQLYWVLVVFGEDQLAPAPSNRPKISLPCAVWPSICYGGTNCANAASKVYSCALPLIPIISFTSS
jgi:predicted transposase YbfD/YdcC